MSQHYQLGPSLMISPPELESGCVISRQDYEILLEGSGASDEKAARDQATAIAFSAFTGLLGVMTGVTDWEHPGVSALVFSIILATATLSTAVLAVYFHRSMKGISGRKSYVDCKERIEKRLTAPAPKSIPTAILP